MKLTRKIVKLAGRMPWVGPTTAFFCALLAYGAIQLNPSFLDPDSFYHAKMAELTLRSGVVKDFPWLPMTTLVDAFADHHYLYHVAMIPFVLAFGTLAGSKASTAVFAAGAVAAFYAAIRAMGVRWPAVFTFAFATSAGLAARMNLTKASGISVAILMLGAYLLTKRRHGLLFLLAFAYVWTHGGWPLLPLMSGAFFAGAVVTDGVSRNTLPNLKEMIRLPEATGFLAAVTGAVAGLIVNPFFPANLKFYWEQTVQIALIGYGGEIAVGSEWKPYDFGNLFSDAGGLMLLLFFGVALLLAVMKWPKVAEGSERISGEEAKHASWSLMAVIALFLLTAKSVRNLEYLIPFLSIFVAVCVSGLVRRIDFSRLMTRLQEIAFKAWLPKVVIGYFLLAFFAVGVRSSWLVAELKRDRGMAWGKYEGASAAIAAEVGDGSLVLHSEWDEFPVLFYNDSNKRYVAGLDPTFMYRKDSAAYEEWRDVAEGRNESVSAYAKEIGASAVFVDGKRREMSENARNDDGLRMIYDDGGVSAYAVR